MAIAVLPCRKDLRTFAREGSPHKGGAIHLRQNTAARIFTGRGGGLERQAGAAGWRAGSRGRIQSILIQINEHAAIASQESTIAPRPRCMDSPKALVNPEYDRSAASSGFEPEGEVRFLWLPLSWSVSNIHGSRRCLADI